MSTPSLPPGDAPQGGMQLTTLLGICLVFLLLLAGGFGALWYFSFSDNAKLKRQLQEQEARSKKLELDKQKATSDEALALARSGQAQALAAVRQATNVVSALYAAAQKSVEHLAVLRTNTTGQEIALYPDLVAQARRLYESDTVELPANVSIIERLESLRRIELQLAEAAGTTYSPDPALQASVTGAEAWARTAMEKVLTVEATLSTLEREARIKVFPGTRPASPVTLAQAIQRSYEGETTQRQKTIIDKTDDAKSAATDLLAKAEADRIIAEAKAKADAILREAEEREATRKRDAQIKDAQEKAKDTDSDLKKQKILDEATRQRLLAKASDSQVQIKLTPLTTPGYYQDRKNGVDKIPVSLTVLQSAGALNPDEKGMNTLARIVSTREDKVRPRLKFAPNYQWKKFPDQIEQVKELQGLLIELAPVLVEKGMLAP